MTEKTKPGNAALILLENQIEALRDGYDSIKGQSESVEKLRGDLAQAERRLAQSKRSLIECEAALAILKAGEPA